MILALLIFAASFDGEAALRHAAKLASLGPHPWGSARNSFAAQYVAAQLREAGLSDVRLQEFESHGIKGANVIGTLRARGPEFIVLGAHHDTVPDAPGAYDDGGGVGVLLEAARVLAKGGARPRTIVFVSFDGEEAWSTRLTTAAGSRAYLKELGPDARNLSAALVIEMCGWGKGAAVLHPIAYRDALGGGSPIIAPGWLVRAASRGAREAGAPFSVGDPLIPWLYQPGVRAFRAVFYGDDLSFLQNGLPAVFLSDSSFTAFYPWYHQAGDTADKLDAAQLGRVGRGVLGIVAALGSEPRGPASDPIWFAAFGRVYGAPVLWAIGVGSLIPGFLLLRSSGGPPLAARIAHAGTFGVLLWRQPIPALWVFLLPNMASATRRRWLSVLSLAPALALLGLGAVGRYRSFVDGSWVQLWEAGLAACGLGLLWVRSSGARGRSGVSRRVARRGRGRRRGLEG